MKQHTDNGDAKRNLKQTLANAWKLGTKDKENKATDCSYNHSCNETKAAVACDKLCKLCPGTGTAIKEGLESRADRLWHGIRILSYKLL